MVEQELREYKRTRTGESVALTITIGDGQLGGSSLKLNGEPLDVQGDVEELVIGDAQTLAGNELEVRTLVADVNLQSNWTSVTYEFSGVVERAETAEHKVKVDGNGVLYRTTFFFFAR